MISNSGYKMLYSFGMKLLFLKKELGKPDKICIIVYGLIRSLVKYNSFSLHLRSTYIANKSHSGVL